MLLRSNYTEEAAERERLANKIECKPSCDPEALELIEEMEGGRVLSPEVRAKLLVALGQKEKQK